MMELIKTVKIITKLRTEINNTFRVELFLGCCDFQLWGDRLQGLQGVFGW